MAAQIEGLKASVDIAKQVITLSTGAVAFTVTFFDKFTSHGSGPIHGVPWSLYVTWACFGAAVLCSLWTLMGITGTLESLDRQANNWTLSEDQKKAAAGEGGSNIKIPALAMLALFLIAIIAMICTGIQVT
jgi:hypothetical protein